jgi:hypothetical protein
MEESQLQEPYNRYMRGQNKKMKMSEVEKKSGQQCMTRITKKQQRPKKIEGKTAAKTHPKNQGLKWDRKSKNK